MKTKKSIIVGLLLCFFLFPAVAENPDSVFSSEVIFYRENVYQGSAVTYRIFSEDSLIVKLSNNSFYVYECNPGVYDFSVEKNRLAMLRLNVEPNKTYYVRFGINVGFWTAVPELLVVDSISARQRIASGSMKQLDGTPTVRPKNRIGLDFGGGAGFNNMTMLETTDGRDVKFSFGGGVLVGLQYGREINKHFDLAFGLKYRSSSLSPTLQNAKMMFGRGVFSATPSYIIPISGGERSRLKLGVGADYYFGTKLKIDLDEVQNGFTDDWKYNNPLGFHVSAIYEVSPSDKFSYIMGVKYANIQYEFERGNFTFPTNEELSRPGGSGIDFVLGFYYHF